MLEQIVAADVEHERDRRPDERDVREVLIGPDPDVHTAMDALLLELAGDVEVRHLIRDDVVGVEKPARLRQMRHESRERRVGGRGTLRGQHARRVKRQRGYGEPRDCNASADSMRGRHSHNTGQLPAWRQDEAHAVSQTDREAKRLAPRGHPEGATREASPARSS